MTEDRPIINTWDQNVRAGGTRVFISYFGPNYGRWGHGAELQVHLMKNGKEFKTDPGAAWYDAGHKTFLLLGPRRGTHQERKQQALTEAIEWANQKYGKREFVRNRIGDYVEAEVNERFPIPRRKR